MTVSSSPGEPMSAPLRDRLAQTIRVVDGAHTMAAGRLAEHLTAEVAAWLTEQAQADHTWQSSTDPRSVREVLDWLAEQVRTGEA